MYRAPLQKATSAACGSVAHSVRVPSSLTRQISPVVTSVANMSPSKPGPNAQSNPSGLVKPVLKTVGLPAMSTVTMPTALCDVEYIPVPHAPPGPNPRSSDGTVAHDVAIPALSTL